MLGMRYLYLTRDIKHTVIYLGLKLRAEVEFGDINLGPISIEIKFNAMSLDKIT